MLTHTLGFPRIGADRELKRAMERYWKGEISAGELENTAAELRLRHWALQAAQGIDLLPAGDFSLYDHMLDLCVTLSAIPPRFGFCGDNIALETYYRLARGDSAAAAMEMTKWFDANYHYLVPEFYPGQKFRLASSRLFDQVSAATAAGYAVKAVIPGPLTFLQLGKEMTDDFDRWTHLDAVVTVYEEILRKLSGLSAWVQIDEPILVTDLPEMVRARFLPVYTRLRAAAGEMKILLATYFGALGDNAPTALSLPVDALHLDLARAPQQLDDLLPHIPAKMSLSLGVVNGRNVWRVNADTAAGLVKKATHTLGADRVLVAPSCSLLHVPFDLDRENRLDPEVRGWLAFAKQKCGEIRLIADTALGRDTVHALAENRAAIRSRMGCARVNDPHVRERLATVTPEMSSRAAPFPARKKIQQEVFRLPPLPTATIGSFPQTEGIRAARRKFKDNAITAAEYQDAMRGFIREVVDRQHELGLDTLVHGEPERNDMVEYFGEQLKGICFTSYGWVQSYGSRCVKPPLIYGDVSRPHPMTVAWSTFAQSLTQKPMKGMLTGPVTILCWSFVRDDQPRRETCRQIALAIRDEVHDLEAAGIGMIQIDEAALREGMPLRRAEREEYLSWAVESFRLATCGVSDQTQIHTHMCYSEFNEIAEWIGKMDADVISIEASRSKMELLKAFEHYAYPNDIGPGVYDIHSPRVPGVEEMVDLLHKALKVIPAERLWVNPDCGLKTRAWPETLASLKNMMEAARLVRAELAGKR